MIDINKLENNCIIITPNNRKNDLVRFLSKTNPYFNVKFLSKNEIMDNAYFTYDYDAIYYVSKKFKYSFELAEEILENLKGIKLDDNNKKLTILFDIYNNLKEKGLLIFNPLFKHIFNNKKCYIYGYLKEDLELIEALNLLGVTYVFIKEELKEYKHTYYLFKNKEDEVNNLFIEILNRYSSGVNLNNMYIYSYGSDYAPLIKKLAIYHDLPIEFNESNKVYNAPLFKKFIDLLNKYDTVVEAFNKLKEEEPYDPSDVMGKIVECINKLSTIKLNKEEYIDFISYLAKKKTLRNKMYEQSIKICNSSSILTDDDYVFIVGFSVDGYPTIHKDVDFYSDKEKEFLNKNTSKIKNIIEETNLSSFIKHTKNIYISYKEKEGKKEFYPSLLIEKLNITKEDTKEYDYRYSKVLSKLQVADYKDMNFTYGIDNKYSNTYSEDDIDYRKYDHTFKGLNNYYNDSEIVLSYTSINEYNKCPFQYFVKRVLKANIFESTFEMEFGNLCHKILEDSLTQDILLDNYRDLILEKFKTEQELFFVDMLLPQVIDVINKNKEHQLNTTYIKQLPEEEIKVQIDENGYITGKIDKTLIDEDNKKLAIIDYKSGGFKFDEKVARFGINMQLPIYSFLLKNKFPDYDNTGIYIQNICVDKRLEEEKPYLLNGLTVNDEQAVKNLDKQLGNLYDEKGKMINTSNYIATIKLKVNKELATNGIYKKEKMEELTLSAESNIKKALDNIRNGRFEIAPVAIVNKIQAHCKYCECRDICFMKEKDIVNIDLDEALKEE